MYYRPLDFSPAADEIHKIVDQPINCAGEYSLESQPSDISPDTDSLACDNGAGSDNGRSPDIGDGKVPKAESVELERDEVADVLREPLAPQISILSIIGLTFVSALIMIVFQQAFFMGKMWASAITVSIFLLVVVFGLYALTFSLANIFSSIAGAAVGPEQLVSHHSPTLEMPLAGEPVESSASESESTTSAVSPASPESEELS